jgi:hypothetical protein
MRSLSLAIIAAVPKPAKVPVSIPFFMSSGAERRFSTFGERPVAQSAVTSRSSMELPSQKRQEMTLGLRMKPRYRGLEHRADLRPRPGLTRPPPRAPRAERVPETPICGPSTAFCARSNARRRRQPAKIILGNQPRPQSDRLRGASYSNYKFVDESR